MRCENGKKLAEKELAKLLMERQDLSQVSFNEIFLKEESPFFWIFCAVSPELQAQGWSPGAINLTIDKKDGHRWNNSEIEKYYESKISSSQLQTA